MRSKCVGEKRTQTEEEEGEVKNQDGLQASYSGKGNKSPIELQNR